VGIRRLTVETRIEVRRLLSQLLGEYAAAVCHQEVDR
jgi:hypothetical protein